MTSLSPPSPSMSPLAWPLADLLSAHTYRHSLYLLLSLPVQVMGSVLLAAGLLTGAATSPVLVGFGILLLTLLGLLAFNAMQRWLAGLLGLRFEPLAAAPTQPAQSAAQRCLEWFRFQLTQPTLWRGAVFHLLAFPLALLTWTVMAMALSLTAVALVGALWPLLGLTVTLGQYTVPPNWAAQWGCAAAALGGLLLSAALINLLARVWVALAHVLLRPDDALAQAQRAVRALGKAAGQVALGENLSATLEQIVQQARLGSGAVGLRLVGPQGIRSAAGAEFGPPDQMEPATPNVQAPQLQRLSLVPSGEVAAETRPTEMLLASFPVRVAGQPWGTLEALFAAPQPPGMDALTLLSGMADHAGTALHAAALAERAAGRAEQEERARLARELHDSVAQALYGISLGAKAARTALESQPERARDSLDYTIALAEGGVSEMKALLFSLRPDALAEGGLLAALEQQAHALRTRYSLTISTEWAGTGTTEPSLSPTAQMAAYRVAQEALHNVVKHAQASEVWLRVQQTGGQLRLTVEDNGRGFDPQASGTGTLGQRSMRERAAEAGGRLEVGSRPGEGTRVELWLPLTPLESSQPHQQESARQEMHA